MVNSIFICNFAHKLKVLVMSSSYEYYLIICGQFSCVVIYNVISGLHGRLFSFLNDILILLIRVHEFINYKYVHFYSCIRHIKIDNYVWIVDVENSSKESLPAIFIKKNNTIILLQYSYCLHWNPLDYVIIIFNVFSRHFYMRTLVGNHR